MRNAGWLVIAVVAACGGGGGDGDDDGDGNGDGDGDGATGDGATGDGGAGDGATGDGGAGDGGAGAGRILFQCDAFNGGICVMDADGSDRQTINATGFAPHDAGGGAIYFHTSTYRVSRRSSGGNVQDLGDGAFARPHPDGRILFQCMGLNGGLCAMASDGGQRTTIKATGRSPDADASNRILFHSDDYHVWRRDPGGGENDLGAGAFPRWTGDGRIVFQCTGLDGGLCRMDADGDNRETLSATGRYPDDDGGGRLVFHSESYQVSTRSTSGQITPLGAGANAIWW